MAKKRIGETSYHETAFGIIPRSQLIPLEIEGIKRAWDFIIKSRTGIPLTTASLKRVHKVGFGWIFPEYGGQFRKIEVKVSKHSPPKSYLVPQLTEDFVKDLKVRLRYLPKINADKFIDELVGLIAWAHHRFLWIHPFKDYNGRIGRLLINIILLNLDLPPIELQVDTPAGRKKYIDALQQADAGSYEKLEKLIRSALEETIGEI